MTMREDITAVLNGETPERTPYTAYGSFFGGPWAESWQRLADLGLGMSHHCSTVQRVEHGVKNSTEERVEGGQPYQVFRKETPAGTIEKSTLNSWHLGGWISKPEDYKVAAWIVENTELTTHYEVFDEIDQTVGDNGVTLVTGSRSPAMKANLEWAGTERFCMDVGVVLDELMELYEAEKKLFLEEVRLIAAGPGQFVKFFENLTIAMLGPRRYAELLVPIYEEMAPVLEAGGKRFMVHYDGALEVIAEQVAAAPFHIIESLTEPPEGDMAYDQCRAAWPDKALWGNINLALYHLPKEELRDAVIAMRERAGKRAFAFEISENFPHNWPETVPVVLEALSELD